MEFKGVKRVSHLPNLTPMIDIVLLLLVFFLLTAHFVRNESIKVDLPTADSAMEVDEKDVVTITLDKEGTFYMDGNPVDENALQERIRLSLQNVKEKVVILKGDKAGAIGKAVFVMDAARKAGADSMDIITQKP